MSTAKSMRSVLLRLLPEEPPRPGGLGTRGLPVPPEATLPHCGLALNRPPAGFSRSFPVENILKIPCLPVDVHPSARGAGPVGTGRTASPQAADRGGRPSRQEPEEDSWTTASPSTSPAVSPVTPS